ncbi:MAG: hypothetical protein OEM38_12470 [Gammaproteobacteria bacterium]|nr:hypothetical protein [Gammaproteobacteria bacterium]
MTALVPWAKNNPVRRVVVIDVNDNPNIDTKVEDKYLCEQTYLQIMGELLRRMETKGR